MARRRRKTFLQRYGWMGLSALALILVVFGIVKLVGSFSRGSEQQLMPTPVPETVQEESLGAEDEPIAEDSEDADFAPDDETEEEEAFVVPEGIEHGVFTGSRRATIRAAGDVILHAAIYKSYKTEGGYDFRDIFTPIAGSLSAADYTIANVDGPTGGTKIRGYSEYPQFNSPPHILTALKEAGVDMLTLANNHALDTFYDGLKYTIDNVEKAGLEHVGAYRSQEEYDTPKVIDINGIKVGITNYTVSTNNLIKSSAKEAAEYGLRMTSNSNVKTDVERLRAYGAEIVIVCMHWGEEYVRTPNKAVINLAKKLAGVGVDVIIGGHSHVVQPAQWVKARDAETGEEKKTLVIYSLGNFLSDQRQQYRDGGIIFEFTLQDDPATGKVEVTNPVYVPTYVWRTKRGDGTGYDYRVIPVGEALQNKPRSMSDDVYARLQEIANEVQQQMGRTGVGTISKS
ncbi:MAG: CapA family protein [Christensenellales bacterium]|jgi:poly-gamma-glutamate capsule biosynthesis protein CapA/YwtB (metallophosphatase superfamily)